MLCDIEPTKDLQTFNAASARCLGLLLQQPFGAAAAAPCHISFLSEETNQAGLLEWRKNVNNDHNIVHLLGDLSSFIVVYTLASYCQLLDFFSHLCSRACAQNFATKDRDPNKCSKRLWNCCLQYILRILGMAHAPQFQCSIRFQGASPLWQAMISLLTPLLPVAQMLEVPVLDFDAYLKLKDSQDVAKDTQMAIGDRGAWMIKLYIGDHDYHDIYSIPLHVLGVIYLAFGMALYS